MQFALELGDRLQHHNGDLAVSAALVVVVVRIGVGHHPPEALALLALGHARPDMTLLPSPPCRGLRARLQVVVPGRVAVGPALRGDQDQVVAIR